MSNHKPTPTPQVNFHDLAQAYVAAGNDDRALFTMLFDLLIDGQYSNNINAKTIPVVSDR
jgi:hypothetical protein